MAQKGNNTFYGLASAKPSTLPEASFYVATDTGEVFAYNSGGLPINVTNKNKILTQNELYNKIQRNRGYNFISSDVIQDEYINVFDDMESQGVNIIRWGFFHSFPWSDYTSETEYDEWLQYQIGLLDYAKPLLEERGIRILLDLHGFFGYSYPDGSLRLLYNQTYFDKYIETWEILVERYGNSGFAGFGLMNEPVESYTGETKLYSGIEAQTLAAKSIREIDKSTPLYFASTSYNAPLPFFSEPIKDIDNVVYEVHFYELMEYTHQGISGFTYDTEYSYPGTFPGWGDFGKEQLRSRLNKVREFQLKYNVDIFVGEFSVVRWAEGAATWLQDVVDMFEEYGWGWAYHAYTVNDVWSLEYENGTTNSTPILSTTITDRKQVILNSLNLNNTNVTKAGNKFNGIEQLVKTDNLGRLPNQLIKNPLDGKTFGVIGDSYVDETAEGGTSSYLPFLKSMAPNTTFIDLGVGGSTVTPYSGQTIQSYWDRLQTPNYLDGLDGVIFQSSPNDWGIVPSIPIGDIYGDLNTTPTTYTNALMQCILKIFEEGITEVYCVVHNFTTDNRNTSIVQRNFINAALNVFNYYALPVADMSSTLGVIFENAAQTLTADKVHLTDPLKFRYANIVYNFISSGSSTRGNPEGLDSNVQKYAFGPETVAIKIYNLEQRIINLEG